MLPIARIMLSAVRCVETCRQFSAAPMGRFGAFLHIKVRREFRGIAWRPKVYVRNPRYPKVTVPGCYFVAHSGGYQLIHKKTNKYLGHYTIAAFV